MDADLDESALGRAFLVAPYASFILDWQGHVLVCNRRAERLYCPQNITEPEAMRGALFSSLTHHTTEVVKELLRMGAAQGILTLNMKSRKIEAASQQSAFRVSLLRSPNRGERLYLLTQDQLKSTANALSSINARNQETREALKHLQASHLQMSQDLLKMEVFTRAASHDLRTPLSTLAGLVELFSTRFAPDLPGEALEYLSYMERAIGNMTDLTHDLLDYAKSTDATVNHNIVDVKAQIEVVCLDLKQQIDAAHARTIVTGPKLDVQADPNFLRILLMNLLSNALKYRHPDRKCEVEFILSNDPDRPSLTVKDNGIGFQASDAHTIFQPFKRLQSHVEGSGVGLSTCLEICRRHGWKLEATGKPDEGAVFNVNF